VKTIITIEDGKVTVQVDDGDAAVVQGSVTAPIIATPAADVKPDEADRPAQPPAPKPPVVETKRTVLSPAPANDCGFCRRRGEPCVRHGGQRAGAGNSKAAEPRVPIAIEPAQDIKVTRSEVAEARQNITRGKGVDEAFEKTPAFKPTDNRPEVRVFDGTRFLDPWNCEQCRGLHRLCGLHKYMHDSGKKPPYNLTERG
jgi:hypothetical protein